MAAKLCIVCAQSPVEMGGIQTIVRDLTRLYSESGYEVHLSTGTDAGPVPGFAAVHSHAAVRRVFTEFLFPFNLLFVAGLTIHLCYLQWRFRFTALIPQDNYLEGLAAALAGRITGCPTVVMDHGTSTNISDRRWQESWFERHRGVLGRLVTPLFRAGVAFQPVVFRLVCRLADRVFYTGYELNDFYNRYGVPEARRRRYDHLIDAEFASPAPDARTVRAIRERYQIPADAFVLSSTSRINFEKGYPQIVRAFNDLVGAVGRDVVLVIAGDTGAVSQTRFRADREKEELLAYLEARGLMPNVRFLGVLGPEEVRDVNRASDVHVYAGIMSCSFSLCVIEAMSGALPCIVTPVPRKQADVITPDLGWVVPPGDARALGEAFIESYRRRSDLPEMGRRSRAYVLRHNTYDAMRQTYVDAITFTAAAPLKASAA